jgi:hypothetical protein
MFKKTLNELHVMEVFCFAVDSAQARFVGEQSRGFVLVKNNYKGKNRLISKKA